MENNQDVVLVYFSQTGSTRRVAKDIAGELEAAGRRVRLVPWNTAETEDFLSAEVIGVGTPCFVSQAPTPVRNTLWALPSLAGKKAFVFATSGGGPGRVLYDLAKPLMAKGANVLGGYLARGTCLHPMPCLVNRFPDRPNDDDLAGVRNFAKSLTAHLDSGLSGPLPESRPDALSHGLGFYHILACFMKDPLMRILLPRPVFTPDRCNQCGVCVSECPTSSLTMSDLSETGFECIRCYRCVTACSQNAFVVKSWKISNFMTWTLYNTTFERWLGDVKKGEVFY